MTSDFSNKEKAFLETLKADTGRDLKQWMQAIGEQDLVHRNDIIDWLRHQGFIFSRASWLERIHHNGGRPIYLSELPPDQMPARDTRRPALRIVASNPDLPASAARASKRPGVAFSPVPSSVVPLKPGAKTAPAHGSGGAAAVQSACNFDDIGTTIAKAKAYGPLARHFLGELASTVPGASTTRRRNHLEFTDGQVFCALVMSPNGLRLCLDLGAREYSALVVKTSVPNPVVKLPENLTHMVVLDDARQIDDALMALVKSANQLVNG